MNKKVSIIIATFNAAKTLSVALDSVLKQSFQDWECIIVDGASKDNTIEIVKSYVERDSRFRYISKPDKGIYDAFNKGWKMAKGEWIYYLGADDEILENGIYSLLQQTNEADIIYGDWHVKLDNGVVKPIQAHDYHVILKKSFCSHQAILMKKIVLQQLDGFNLKYKLLADFDLLQRAYLLAKFRFIKSSCFVACFQLGGSSSNLIKTEIERYKIIKSNKSYQYPIYLLITMISKKIYWRLADKFKK